MKINSISPTFYQKSSNLKKIANTQELSAQEPRTEQTFSTSFRAVSCCGFKKLNLKNEELKKVFLIAKNLPNNSRIEKLCTITLNNEKFAYKIKKDSTGRTCVEIKNKIQEFADWEKTLENQQSFVCNFNSSGMLVGAKIIDDNIMKPLNVVYEYGREGRHLFINDVYYTPLQGETDLWGIVPFKKSKCIVRKENIANTLENNVFASTLLELGRRTSIALLKK